MDNINKKLLITTIVSLILSVFLITFLLFKDNGTQESVNTITTTDTVTVIKRDTIFNEVQKTIVKPIKLTETIIKYDTITTESPQTHFNVPITASIYQDSITLKDKTKVQYRAIISGYEQSLDTIEFNVKYPMITNTVTNTITNEKTITKYKNPKITAGIAAGAGLPGFAYLGIGILVIGYIASLVVWLVFMVKPSNEGANKFGEPAEIKELSSFSIKAE